MTLSEHELANSVEDLYEGASLAASETDDEKADRLLKALDASLGDSRISITYRDGEWWVARHDCGLAVYCYRTRESKLAAVEAAIDEIRQAKAMGTTSQLELNTLQQMIARSERLLSDQRELESQKAVLQTRINSLRDERGALLKSIKAERDRVKKEQQEHQERQQQQQKHPLYTGPPAVTDHALVRYAERVLGVDMDAARETILTEQNKKLIEFQPNCKIKCGKFRLVVENRKVVTVTTKDS